MGERLNIWMLGGISLLLVPGSPAGRGVRNVALHGPAVQSGDRGGNAGRAVDGNRNSGDDTCTYAQSQTGPWWRVDLQREYTIDGVAVTSGGSSLDGVGIWIGNSGSLATKDNTRCAVVDRFPRKATLYVPCRGFEGRYVIVLLPFPDRALRLCEVEVYPVRFVYPIPNVALKGEAAQSSTFSTADASKAIDGRRNSFYASGSCSHTGGGETHPWWRVDLGRAFVVMYVKVTNRGDCCAENLDGAEIRIGNALENDGNSNPRCAVITRIRAGKTSTFRCTSGFMAGRFVNIVIPGLRDALSLCEVEVYGTAEEAPLRNVALNKPAKWSSESTYHPSAAVSGCRNVASSDCCETSVRPDYWRVDLENVYKVRAVTVINSGKHVEHTDIYVRYRGSTENDKCFKASPQNNSLTHTFHCDDKAGRFVEVHFPTVLTSSSFTITLCEVEVYAAPVLKPESTESPAPTATPPAPPSESVELNGRTVTAVGERLCWSDALLYCRRRHSDLLSLHSEEEQAEVARLLRRVPFQVTDGVWLGLRKYIMGETWFWMSGDSMEFTHWPPHFVPHQYSSPCGSMDVDEPHQWADRSCDQHLNFVCQSGDGIGLERVPFHSYV